MDVIGARFDDLASAMAARDAILATVAMEPVDVAVRPLGTTRYDRPIEAFLLAGRFASSAVEAVTRLVRDRGGTIISRRTESHAGARPDGGRAEGHADAAGRGHGLPRRTPGRASALARKGPRRPAARLRVRAARDPRLRA